MAKLISLKPSGIDERFEKPSGGQNVACNSIRKIYCIPLIWPNSYSENPQALRSDSRNPMVDLRASCNSMRQRSHRGSPLTLKKGSETSPAD